MGGEYGEPKSARVTATDCGEKRKTNKRKRIGPLAMVYVGDAEGISGENEAIEKRGRKRERKRRDGLCLTSHRTHSPCERLSWGLKKKTRWSVQKKEKEGKDLLKQISLKTSSSKTK